MQKGFVNFAFALFAALLLVGSATASGTTPSVDMKINGVDNPSQVPFNSTFTVSWTSSNAEVCWGYGHNLPLVNGSPWIDNGSLPTAGNRVLVAAYLGQFQIGITCANGTPSATDEAQVQVVPATVTNQPPVITSIGGPTSINSGQAGTWTISAYDPDGNSLTYDMNWGDAGSHSPISAATFQHTYSSAGTYTITAKVTDSAGASTQSTITVNVASAAPPQVLGKISYWWGKVNMHNSNGAWVSDPDGSSGASIEMVQYCKKFFPGTTEIRDSDPETINGWKDVGNMGSYSSLALTYQCVASSEQGSATSTIDASPNVASQGGQISAAGTVSNPTSSTRAYLVGIAYYATVGGLPYQAGNTPVIQEITLAPGETRSVYGNFVATTPNGQQNYNLAKISVYMRSGNALVSQSFDRVNVAGSNSQPDYKITGPGIAFYTGTANNGVYNGQTAVAMVPNAQVPVSASVTNIGATAQAQTEASFSFFGRHVSVTVPPLAAGQSYPINSFISCASGDTASAFSVAVNANHAMQESDYSNNQEYLNGHPSTPSGEMIYCNFTGISNQPPVITNTGGPTSLSLNQQGTWSVGAYDPDGTYLTYNVVWGDEASKGMQASTTFSSTATFQHTYTSAGAYTITFTVKDAYGATAQNMAYVTVGGYSSGCDPSFNHLTVGQMLQVPPMTNTYGVKLIDISADSDRAAMVQILDSNEAVLDYAKVVPGTKYVYAGKNGNLAIETCNAASASNDVNSAWIKGAMTASPGTDICAGYHTLIQDQVLDVGIFYVRLDGVSTAQGIPASQRYANIDIMTPVGMLLDKKEMYPGTAYSYTQNGTANTVNVKLCDTAYGTADGKKWVKIDATAASAPNNLPPVITGVSGPSSLSTGSAGTWKVSANDPDGTYLTYSVNWGEGSGTAKSGSGNAYATATFEHTYSKAGTYTVKFTVTDIAGATAQSSAVVNVAGSTITPSEKLSFKIKKGWNMLSSPADTTSGIDVMAIAQKCDVATNAWEYDAANGKYVASSSIKPNGAWLRANEDCEFWIDPPYTTRVRFVMSAGWNIVGAPGTATAFSSMTGNCKVTSGPWAYSPSSGQYSQSRLLEPTNAYWVKVASACTMESLGDLPPSAPTN